MIPMVDGLNSDPSICRSPEATNDDVVVTLIALDPLTGESVPTDPVPAPEPVSVLVLPPTPVVDDPPDNGVVGVITAAVVAAPKLVPLMTTADVGVAAVVVALFGIVVVGDVVPLAVTTVVVPVSPGPSVTGSVAPVVPLITTGVVVVNSTMSVVGSTKVSVVTVLVGVVEKVLPVVVGGAVVSVKSLVCTIVNDTSSEPAENDRIMRMQINELFADAR